MAVVGLVGCQWGDEGKGKIVDILSADAEIVARYQGGPNAGHTVIIGDSPIILHTIPTGILHDHTQCLIGHGVVINLESFAREIEQLESLKYRVREKLFVSDNAHIIMPYHQMLDKVQERLRGTGKIGTTGRGIGCAYADKALRQGIRIVDLFDKDRFTAKAKGAVKFYNTFFEHIDDDILPLKADEVIDHIWAYSDTILPMVVDGVQYINDSIKMNKRILCEGAQGVHLDIDMGTYPFVTSSNPTPGGMCTGLGIPPHAITRLIGVVKAYTTRVGEGPFPTEQLNDIGTQLRNIGAEYGATTGRPRRCGWLDIPVLRRSIQITGIRDIALTKIDVLDTFAQISICTRYKYRGKVVDVLPFGIEQSSDIEPVFETVPGWKTSTADITSFEDMPQNARKYVKHIEELLKVRIFMVSVGPQRRRAILRDNNFWQ